MVRMGVSTAFCCTFCVRHLFGSNFGRPSNLHILPPNLGRSESANCRSHLFPPTSAVFVRRLSHSSPKRLPLPHASVNMVPVPVLMTKLKQGYQSPSPEPLPPPQPWRPAYHKGIQIRPFPRGVCARSAQHKMSGR